jgi:hypothetical protein
MNSLGNSLVDTEQYFFAVKAIPTSITIGTVMFYFNTLSGNVTFDVGFYRRDTSGFGNSFISVNGTIDTFSAGSQTGFRPFVLSSPQVIPALTGSNALFMGLKIRSLGGNAFTMWGQNVTGLSNVSITVGPVASGAALVTNPGAPVSTVTFMPYIELF